MNTNGANRDRTHEELTDLLSGYALGALDTADERAVVTHLASCPVCQRELEELRETVGLLAFAAPPTPPRPAVKAALLARMERPDELPARAEAFTTTVMTTPPARVVPPVRPVPVGPAAGARRRWAYALAAVAAALLLALGGWNVALQGRLRDEQRQAAENATIVALLNNPAAAHSVTGTARGEYDNPPAGYVYTDPNGTTGLMLTYWLPPLGPGQRYQLWLITPSGERDSGGLFTVDDHGNAHVVIRAPAPFAKYNAIGVTAEPWNGSPRPTGPRVIGGQIQ